MCSTLRANTNANVLRPAQKFSDNSLAYREINQKTGKIISFINTGHATYVETRQKKIKTVKKTHLVNSEQTEMDCT